MPSMRELIDAAQDFGAKPPRKTTHIDLIEQRNRRIIQMYIAGLGLREIGAKYGIGEATVGVVVRKEYGAQPRLTREQSYTRAFKAFVLHGRGFTYREVGKICGGVGVQRARELAGKGRRIWYGMVARLHSNRLADWEKDALRGVTITYDIEGLTPSVE